jgi:hypothetical protein
MLNYEKWKKLNESFMMSSPIGGITHNNGFLAYSPLSEAEMDRDEDEDMEDEDMEDEDMEDEDMEDEDMDDEDMEDEDMEDEDMDDEDMDDEDMDDEDMDDEDMDDEDMDDEDDGEMEIQDDAGEIEEIEDGDESEDSDDGAVHHHHHHYHGHKNKEAYSDDADEEAGNEMMCKRCGSYMANENHDCGIDEWAASVKSLINPVILQKLNGKILTEASFKGAKIDIKDGEVGSVGAVKSKLKTFLDGVESQIDSMTDRQRYSILSSVVNALVTDAELPDFLKFIKMEKSSIVKSDPKETEEKMYKGRVSKKKSGPCKKCSTSMKFMPAKSGKYAGKNMPTKSGKYAGKKMKKK